MVELAGIRTSHRQATKQAVSNALAYQLCGLRMDEVRSIEAECVYCKD